MTVQYSVAVRNAQLDAFETTVGVSAKLQIFSGAQPASCATADSGTQLAELDLPADWMAAASGGTKSLLGTWQDAAADATGVAGHFRIKDNGETTCHMQGSITGTGGGGDMELDNTNIAVGQEINVTAFTIARGNA